jgi:hypothetical protein
LRTLAKLIPAESRLVIEPAKRAQEAPQQALETVGVPTNSIRQGDVLRVLPGERIPVDGEILEGRCSLDESMLTGESALVNKGEGAQVETRPCSLVMMLCFCESSIFLKLVLSDLVCPSRLSTWPEKTERAGELGAVDMAQSVCICCGISACVSRQQHQPSPGAQHARR